MADTVFPESLSWLVSNDYEKIVLDLGTARTDVVVATNVISLKILRFTTGAIFTIKFIDATKSGLTQEDLPIGAEIVNFMPTNVLLTNTAQTGLSLELLVFRRT